MPPRTDANSWITQGRLVPAVWRLALPMAASMLLHNLFSLVDMYFVGMLGKEALAAVGACGAMMGMIFMLAMGVTTGCTALVARAIGAGDRRRAEKVAAQSLVLAVGLSGLVAALGVPLAGSLLRVMGADEEVVAAGRPYLQIVAGGSIVMFLSVTFGAAVRAAGDAKTPLKVMALATVVNIALDPIFIFGPWGLPAMGVAGSAWATVIARGVATVVLVVIFFVRGHEHFHLRLRHLRPDFRIMGQILRVGVFSSGQMLVRSISALVLVPIVATFGTGAMAAYLVVLRLWMAAVMPGLGFGNAAATLMGQNLGAGRPDRAARAGWITAGIYTAFVAVASAVCLIWTEPLVRIFNDNPALVPHAVAFLRWIAPPFLFLALSTVLGRGMNGAGDTLVPLAVVAVSVLGLRIPLAWLLAVRVWNDVGGVWVAMAASSVLQGLLFAAAFQWGRWKRVSMGGGGVKPISETELMPESQSGN